MFEKKKKKKSGVEKKNEKSQLRAKLCSMKRWKFHSSISRARGCWTRGAAEVFLPSSQHQPEKLKRSRTAKRFS